MTEDLPSDDIAIRRYESSQTNIRSQVFALGVDINSSEIITVESVTHDTINIDSPEIGSLKVVLERVLIHWLSPSAPNQFKNKLIDMMNLRKQHSQPYALDSVALTEAMK